MNSAGRRKARQSRRSSVVAHADGVRVGELNDLPLLVINVWWVENPFCLRADQWCQFGT
jgi:hypothetical protein